MHVLCSRVHPQHTQQQQHKGGEHGYIRISRATGCGTDNNPGQGNICTGGPATVPVCGTCGIFYSVSFPTMA